MRVRTFLAALALFVLICVIFVQLTTLRCFRLIGDVTCHVETSQPVVALTFNRAPDPAAMDEILPALSARNAKATFFLLGSVLEPHPEQGARIATAGHEIGSSGYDRVALEEHPLAFYQDQIGRTQSLIKDATGKRPQLFRPPYGTKSVGLIWELYRADYRMILWDISDVGMSKATPEGYASAVLSQAAPGSIMSLNMMGPDGANARKALPLILDGLEEKGLRPVTVSELLNSAD